MSKSTTSDSQVRTVVGAFLATMTVQDLSPTEVSFIGEFLYSMMKDTPVQPRVLFAKYGYWAPAAQDKVSDVAHNNAARVFQEIERLGFEDQSSNAPVSRLH